MRVAAGLADPTHGIVFILPFAGGIDDSPPSRLRVVIQSLFDGGGKLPIAAAANLFVAAADLPLEALRSAPGVKRLVVDDLSDFWRDSPLYYEAFDEIAVYAFRRRHMPSQFHSLMRQAYGARVRIEWLDAPRQQEGGP